MLTAVLPDGIEIMQPFTLSSDKSQPSSTHLDLGDFDFWRARLVTLYGAFQAPPAGIHQTWHDRRNPMQWWTFWPAALTIATYSSERTELAREQVRLAQLAFEVSLSQATGRAEVAAYSRACPYLRVGHAAIGKY
jgi:hypothetical protein